MLDEVTSVSLQFLKRDVCVLCCFADHVGRPAMSDTEYCVCFGISQTPTVRWLLHDVTCCTARDEPGMFQGFAQRAG